MNVASLVLRAHPHHVAGLRRALASIPGSEVHAVERGRVVVTVEDTPGHACADALLKVQQLDHVISLTLAYEHSESDSTPQELPS